MKKNQITKQNSFKRLAVNPEGRLIDATKDVTEKDLAQIQYRRLQENQWTIEEVEERMRFKATDILWIAGMIISAALIIIL